MTKLNLDFIKDSKLHDYEMDDIKIDYNSCTIILSFKTPSGNLCLLNINNFIVFYISHTEEWGMGKYVSSSNIEFDNISQIYDLEIQLNSGDIIFIQYKE